MNLSAFVRGMCVGMIAGAAVDMMASSSKNQRKTTVGKAMQRVGNSMDSALDDISDRLH